MKNNKRAETGAMQFGGDWPGVFIRGDNAAYFSMILREVLKNPERLKEDAIAHGVLHGLANALGGCVVAGEDPPGIQYMKAFDEAASGGPPKPKKFEVDGADVPPEHLEWFIEGVRHAALKKE